MTKEELIRRAMQALDDYDKKYTLKEQFQHLIDAGVIDTDGNVLLIGERPKPSPSPNGQASAER